jgi:hypothetical protein
MSSAWRHSYTEIERNRISGIESPPRAVGRPSSVYARAAAAFTGGAVRGASAAWPKYNR